MRTWWADRHNRFGAYVFSAIMAALVAAVIWPGFPLLTFAIGCGYGIFWLGRQWSKDFLSDD